MASDKRTIGLTVNGRSVMSRMMDQRLFRDQIDAARFAMAVAINSGIASGQAEGTDTTWNVGSFDPDGEIRRLLPALFSDTDTPYRLLEYLIDAGLALVGAHIEEFGELDINSLMSDRASVSDNSATL